MSVCLSEQYNHGLKCVNPIQILQSIISHFNHEEGPVFGALRATCRSLCDRFDTCNQTLILGERNTAPATTEKTETGIFTESSTVSKREKLDLAVLTRVLQRTPSLTNLSILPTITWHQASKLVFNQPKSSKSKVNSSLQKSPELTVALESGLSRLSLKSCSGLSDLSVIQPLASRLKHLNLR